MVPVDQSKSKLADRNKLDEIAEYNHKNETQLERRNSPAVATHLIYEDGRKWYSNPKRQEYYELMGKFYKSAGDPDKTAGDTPTTGKLNYEGNLIIEGVVADKLMVMGDPAKDGEPYKGDIDHGLNAFSKEYYQNNKKEIRPEWITTSGEAPKAGDTTPIFGGSSPEQLVLAAAEMKDPKLESMIRHSAENFFNLSNHRTIQEDLVQGIPLMMPDGGLVIIEADVTNNRVGYLDSDTLTKTFHASKNPKFDAERMLVEKLNEMSETHAVFPNPRWGWNIGDDGKFIIPEGRIDFQLAEQEKTKLSESVKTARKINGIKNPDSLIEGWQTKLTQDQKDALDYYQNQKAQLETLEKINNLYSSIIAYQFNQKIFDGKSEYRDEVAGVVVDAKGYKKAVEKLKSLNDEFHDKVVECGKKSGIEPEESEKTPCLFAQGGKKMMEDLKSFDSKKFEKEECEKVVAPKELDIIEGESWVARITRSATKNAGRQ